MWTSRCVGMLHCVQAARELKLEPNKSIKLECNSQLGYFLRVTKKVKASNRAAIFDSTD